MNQLNVTPDFSNTQKPITERHEMLTITESGGHRTLRLNSSSLSVIQTCARKSQYLLYDGWHGKTEADSLLYGRAMHKALEIFYEVDSKHRELPQNFDRLAPCLTAETEPDEKHFIWDAMKAFVQVGDSLKNLPETDKRSLTSGIWVLSHYIKTYLHDGYSVYRDEKGPFLERKFTIDYGEFSGISVHLFGTIDFAFQSEVNGTVLIGDHKTTSMMGNPFLTRIKPNHQYTGYLIGAKQAFGLDGEQFLINGIGVKAKPVTSRGGPPTFTRQVTRRNETDFKEFRDVVAEAVHSYLRWKSLMTWPLGPVDACSNYGGCQYLDVCAAPNQLRNNILESKFERTNYNG